MSDNLRHRLVVDTMGQENVSGLILTDEHEIAEALELELRLHRETGWDTTQYGATLRFQKGDKIRWVWVRSRTPEEDTT